MKTKCKHDFKFYNFSPITFKAEYKCRMCSKTKHIQFIKK